MSKYQEKMFEVDPHDGNIFCIPSLLKNAAVEINNSTANSPKSFSLGDSLQSHYPLLEFVFEFLEATDLNSAKCVNSTWCISAVRELQKRSFPTWISCCHDPGLCLRASPGFRYNSVALGLVVYNPKTIKLERYVCVHGSPDCTRMTFAEYLGREVVPDGIEYCAIATSEVTRNIKEIKCRKSVFQSVFIPVIPKVKVKMFRFNPKHGDVSQFISSNEDVKCMLVFSQKYRLTTIESLIAKVLQGQKPRSVALGGGLIKSTKEFVKNNPQKLFRSDDFLCITLFQDRDIEIDFNAYSVVINSDTVFERHYEIFEEDLLKFKELLQQRSNGMIFRFCCCAKTYKDKETKIISKHFPRYPILGLDVDGEIGWDTSDMPEEEQEESDSNSKSPSKIKKQKVSLPQTLHGWSTVLVIITWGKKLSCQSSS